MATPNDNTEVIRMWRGFKDSIWKSATPMGATDRLFGDYVSSSRERTRANSSDILTPKLATKLNFSTGERDDSQIFSDPAFVKSLQTPESLKRKLMNKEAELQASKAKLSEKESLISVMVPSNKKLCMSLETRLEESRRQNELDNKKIEELKAKIQCTKSEASYARRQLSELEHKKKMETDKYEMRLVTLQQECSNFKLEIANLKSEKAESLRKLQNDIGRLELQVSMMSQEADKSNDYIQLLKRQNGEMLEKAALCSTLQKELQEAQQTIRHLEAQVEEEKDAALIVKSFQADLKLLSQLQEENRNLKQELAAYQENNIALYQEKMWTCQEKLQQAEKKLATFTKLQAENEQLKKKLSQWEGLVDDGSVTSFKSPSTFARRLSHYQKNEAILTNKFLQASSRLDTVEKQKCEQDEIVKRLTSRLEENSSQNMLIKRLQRKVLLLSKERDTCRQLFDSYISESTLSNGVVMSQYMTHLEQMNQEYEKTLEKGDRDVEALSQRLKELTSTSELHKLREENTCLLQKLKTLEQENSNSQEQAQKIVHLKLNPLENASQKHLEEFQKLQEENDSLKKRVSILEEEGPTDVTAKVQLKLQTEGADSQLKGLQDRLAASERQQKFILDNARIKSQQFREAVYRLTGYRIDMPTAETYKLSHVYADSRDDFLIFQINSKGTQLVETEYSKQLTEKLELYLQQYDSFPAFLASLTIDLFNQQTCVIIS